MRQQFSKWKSIKSSWNMFVPNRILNNMQMHGEHRTALWPTDIFWIVLKWNQNIFLFASRI